MRSSRVLRPELSEALGVTDRLGDAVERRRIPYAHVGEGGDRLGFVVAEEDRDRLVIFARRPGVCFRAARRRFGRLAVRLCGRLTVRSVLDETYSGSGYSLTVEFSAEGVRVASSDCPNQDCVHTGEIHHAGRSIVCLPARISIQLTGGAEDAAVDAVIG